MGEGLPLRAFYTVYALKALDVLSTYLLLRLCPHCGETNALGHYVLSVLGYELGSLALLAVSAVVALAAYLNVLASLRAAPRHAHAVYKLFVFVNSVPVINNVLLMYVLIVSGRLVYICI